MDLTKSFIQSITTEDDEMVEHLIYKLQLVYGSHVGLPYKLVIAACTDHGGSSYYLDWLYNENVVPEMTWLDHRVWVHAISYGSPEQVSSIYAFAGMRKPDGMGEEYCRWARKRGDSIHFLFANG